MPPLAGTSGTHPVPPSNLWLGAQRQITFERLQIIYKIACIDLREFKMLRTPVRNSWIRGDARSKGHSVDEAWDMATRQ
jgi:hypothetical protein